MIKIIFCLRRLPNLSRNEFQEYWRNAHAPLVAAHADVLGIRRYVQSHTLDDPAFARLAALRGGASAYDGVAELWIEEFKQPHSSERAALEKQARQELLDDEKRFIDLKHSPIFYAFEEEIVDDGQPLIRTK